MKPKQCCGINSASGGGSKKGDRCKVMVKDFNTRLKKCLNDNKDLCFMHCDCAYCLDTYETRSNRGKRHKSTLHEGKANYDYLFNRWSSINLDAPDFLLKEKDIEKLRIICLVVYKEYNHLWSDIVSLAKKRKENKKTLQKIAELELELNKLKEKLE